MSPSLSHKNQSRFRPRLETLEDRCLLSAGDLDPTFGTGGLVITDINATSNRANDLVIQPDGKILAAGSARQSNTLNDFALVRYNSNGSRDTSFGNNGVVVTDLNRRSDTINAVALQSDGKIVVGGSSFGNKPFNFDPQLALARYLPNGTLDKSFGSKGTVRTDLGSQYNDSIHALAIQSDGKIVAAGVTAAFAGGDNFLLARYTSSGNLDSTFGNGGFVVTDFGGADWISDLVIQSDGKLVVAGRSNTSNNFIAVARYNANGTLDTTFGTGGKVTTLVGTRSSEAIAVDVRPDGRILVAGNFSYLVAPDVSKEGLAMVRYLADGSLDPSFDGDGMAAIIDLIPDAMFTTSGMTVQPNGKILVAGTQFSASERNFAVVRLNPDGSLDPTFGGVGWVTTDFNASAIDDHHFAQTIGLQGDGKIVVAGSSNVQTSADFALARYIGDSPLLAASAPVAAVTGARLSEADLAPIIAEAVRRLQAAGANTSSLASLSIRITDLGGATLGMTDGRTIWLDDDAAGWGWFVDSTPGDDSEFLIPGDQGERGKMDLLSVLMHEMGHVVGLDHDDEGVMVETLAAGERAGVSEGPDAVADHLFGRPASEAASAPVFWGDVAGLLAKKMG